MGTREKLILITSFVLPLTEYRKSNAKSGFRGYTDGTTRPLRLGERRPLDGTNCAPILVHALMQGVWCGLCRYWGPLAGVGPKVGSARTLKYPKALGTRPHTKLRNETRNEERTRRFAMLMPLLSEANCLKYEAVVKRTATCCAELSLHLSLSSSVSSTLRLCRFPVPIHSTQSRGWPLIHGAECQC